MEVIDYKKLAEPFLFSDLEWRIGSSGKKRDGSIWARALVYCTNRAIQQRLDDVVGPSRWSNDFKPGPLGGLLCGITILTEHGSVTKWDGGDNTEYDAIKGGLSGAMKRAAVQWGIGRYLYDVGEFFAIVTENGEHWAKTKDGESFRWNAPSANDFPKWALPAPAAPKQLGADSAEFKAALERIERETTHEGLETLADRLSKSDKFVEAASRVLAAAIMSRAEQLADVGSV